MVNMKYKYEKGGKTTESKKVQRTERERVQENMEVFNLENKNTRKKKRKTNYSSKKRL